MWSQGDAYAACHPRSRLGNVAVVNIFPVGDVVDIEEQLVAGSFPCEAGINNVVCAVGLRVAVDVGI